MKRHQKRSLTSEAALMKKRPLKFLVDAKLSKRMGNRFRFLLLSALSVALIANTLISRSMAIGIAVSLVFLYLNFVAAGKLFFSGEAFYSKIISGLATFVLIMTFVGTGLVFAGIFTEKVSIGALIVVSFILYFLAERTRKPQLLNSTLNSLGAKEKTKNKVWLLVPVFLFSIVASFYLLFLGRTGDGGASVWLTIPESFIPVFLLASLLLGFIVLFSDLSYGSKLVSISIFSLLVHSLFIVVWYPGRYGDPWTHLGHARYVAKTGMPYGYTGLIGRGQFVDILKYRAQQVLVVFFGRMFYVDVYWVSIVLVPLLWSILVPFLSYRIAESLSSGKSRLFPLLAALSTEIASPLIGWGAVTVPNSLGFIFLFLTVALLFCWMDKRGRWMWLLVVLAAAVSFFSHPLTGMLAFMLLFLGTVVRKVSSIFLKILSYGFTFASYPFLMIYFGANFSFEGLIALDNYLSFQSTITTILLVFGLVGLVLGIMRKYVDTMKTMLLFVFYFTIEFEYYFVSYGMTELPFTGRILPTGFLLLAPLVALGFLTMAEALRNVDLHFSMRVISKRIKVNMNLRKIGILLICLFFSIQVTSGLYSAYPREEIVKVQPSQYEIDAVYYIKDSVVERPYVVVGSPIFAGLATGFLGAEYAYFGEGADGWFGVASWGYPLQRLYRDMTNNPSIGIMETAMTYIGAKTCYFVVSARDPKFDKIVQEASNILPVDRVFGDGKLYAFKYPLPLVEESGPDIKVVFDDGASVDCVPTRISYMLRSEVNASVTVSGHSTYNITDYPPSWTFLELTVNNMSTSYDNCSDINVFVYKSGLLPNDVLTVKWLSNLDYPDVGWKEDSFDLNQWQRYTGSITPTIATDGNILSISWNYTPPDYNPYYYITNCNISTNDYQYILIRWKSTGPIAVAGVHFELGGQLIVNYGSQSSDWTITIFELEPHQIIKRVLVGITNLRGPKEISGLQTLYIDYILISNRAPPQ